jgi:hypothetical protein
MIFFKYVKLFLIFLFISCLYTKKLTQQESIEQENAFINFQDQNSLISLTLEKDFKYHHFLQENEKYYIFEWYDKSPNQDDLLYRLELRIFNSYSNYYNELKNPNYEAYFLKMCNCNINNKGWILLKNINARIFHYNLQNIYGISVHFNKDIYLIEVAILSKNYELAQKKLDFILKNLTIL